MGLAGGGDLQGRRGLLGNVTVGEVDWQSRVIGKLSKRHSRESLPSTPIGGGNPERGTNWPVSPPRPRLDSRLRGNDVP